MTQKFNWLFMCDSSKVVENKAKYNKKLKRYINYPQLLVIHSLLKQDYELKEDYLIFNSTFILLILLKKS